MAQLQSTSITGSLIVTQGITGSFSGSITNAVSASYAATASYALNAGDSVWTGSAGNIYYNGGNVGIGTSSPYSKLEVTSVNVSWGEGIIINPADSGYGSVFFRAEGTAGSTYTGTWAVGKNASSEPGGELLQVVKNGLTGGTGYRVDALQQWKTNGDSIFGFNVGIGTTSPSQKLDVSGYIVSDRFYPRNSNNVYIYGDTGGLSVQGAGYFYVPASGGSYFQGTVRFRSAIHDDTNAYFTIQGGTSGVTYFSGNVGIGTTNPSSKLDVNGSLNATSINTSLIANGPFETYGMSIPGPTSNFGNGKVYLRLMPSASAAISTLRVTITTTWNWSPGFGYITADYSFYNSGGTLNYGTRTVLTANGQAASTLRLGELEFENGYLSIPVYSANTNTIGVRIEEYGGLDPTTFSYSSWISESLPGQNSVYVPTNIGIGITNPQAKLDVYKGLQTDTITRANSAAYIWGGDIGLAIGQYASGPYGTWLQSLKYDNNASFPLSLNPSGGNVGIGTNNPGNLLTVNGSTRIVTPTLGGLFAYDAASGGAFIWALTRYTDTNPNDLNVNALSGFGVRTGVSSLTTSGHQFYITSGGNIGIGTTAPLFNLQVGANAGTIATTTIRLQNSYLDTNGYYGFNIDAVDNGVNGHDLRFLGRTSPTSGFSELVRIKNGGNVGIGTSNPTSLLELLDSGGQKLQLDGNEIYHVNDSPFYVKSSGDIVFQPDATTYVTFKETGNVGIGTTSPLSKLQISSGDNTDTQLLVGQSATYGAPSIRFKTSGTNYMGLGFTAGSAVGDEVLDAIAIQRTGNVGIGTTSPSTKLHVEGGTLLVKSNVNNGSAILTIKSSDDYGYTFSRNNTTGFLTFDGNQTGAIGYVFNNGNVGIGTASPSQKLEVAGYGLFQSGVVGSSGLTLYGDNSSPRGARLTTAGSFLLGDTAVPGESAWYGTAVFGKNGTDKVIAGYLTSLTNGAVVGGHNSALTAWAPLHIDGTEIRFNIQESRVATINSSGNVGIGITNPAYKLDVIGNTRVYGSYLVVDQTSGYSTSIILNQSGLIQWYMTNQASTGKLVFGNGNGDLVWIGTTGNVGIGTSSPSGKLHVSSTGETALIVDSTSSGTARINLTGAGGGAGAITSTVGGLYMYASGNNPMTLNTSGSERVRIAGDGNVGIGTNSPSTKLDVAGGIISTGTYQARMIGGVGGAYFGSMTAVPVIFQVNQNEVSRFDTNGNLGIGTTSPASRLHVYNDSDVWHTRIGGGSGELRIGGQTANGAVIQAYTPGGSQRDLYIQRDGGSVGIGTFSPTATLQINGAGGDSAPTLRLISAASDTFNWASDTRYANLAAGETSIHLIGKANSQYNQAYFGYRHVSDGSASNMLTLGLYASDYLLNILGSGNVGIGNTTPGYKLDVTGDINFSSTLKFGGVTVIGNSGADVYANIRVIRNESTSLGDGMYIGYNNSGGSSGHLRFYANGTTERMRIDASNGYVGIGTTSPGYLLDVAGTSRSDMHIFRSNQSAPTADAFIFRPADNTVALGTANTERMRITSGGNVGIGTTNPASKVEILDTANGTSFTLTSDGANEQFRIRRYSDNNKQLIIGYHSSNFATIQAVEQSVAYRALALQPNGGNVGIGTTSPSRKLDVAGDMTLSTGGYIYGDSTNPYLNLSQTNGTLLAYGSTSQLYLAGSVTTLSAGSNYLGLITNGSERMRITSGGNVGIGVTAPQAKLQVSGSSNVLNVRGSGSVATSSIFSVDGNNGRLFEVSDDLSNSLFSVNTIAGLPVIEAFADYTVTMGTYGAYTLQVTGSRVGVGTSSPGYPLHVSGSVSGISIYATNDIAAFSDQSVKTDLQVIDSAVDRIKQINGYTYVRVDDLSNTRRAGVIAQEVQKVLPEVVSENQDGTLNVAYQNMIALLIEGMKEQQAQIDELKQRLDNL